MSDYVSRLKYDCENQPKLKNESPSVHGKKSFLTIESVKMEDIILCMDVRNYYQNQSRLKIKSFVLLFVPQFVSGKSLSLKIKEDCQNRRCQTM